MALKKRKKREGISKFAAKGNYKYADPTESLHKALISGEPTRIELARIRHGSFINDTHGWNPYLEGQKYGKERR